MLRFQALNSHPVPRRAGQLGLVTCLAAALTGVTRAQDRRPPKPPSGQGKQAQTGKALTGKARAALLAKVQKAMQKRTAVAATFVTEKHYALFDEVVRHRGFILYQRPDRLRWEIQHPFRSILVVAGADVAKFEFRKGTRRKLALGRAQDVLRIVMDQIRGWFRGQFEKGAKDYTVQLFAAQTQPPSPARVVLTPKSKSLRKTVQSFELRLAADLSSVEQVTIRESGGDRTVMRFTLMPAGQQLRPAHFSVKDPSTFTAKRPPAPAPAKRGTSGKSQKK